MVGVKIDTGPIGEASNSIGTPREQWPKLIEWRREYIATQFGYDCRNIVDWVHDAERMWQQLGYASVGDLVQDGLGVDPVDVGMVVEWLKRYRPNQPVSLPEAIKQALLAHGGNHNPKGRNQYSDNSESGQGSVTTLTTQDRGANYNIRRLNRDNPELANRVMAGELSPDAAAVEAGFRKRRFRLPDDPYAAGRYLAERVDREWFDALIDAYYKAIE